MGIKSMLWILAILRGVYGVMWHYIIYLHAEAKGWDVQVKSHLAATGYFLIYLTM